MLRSGTVTTRRTVKRHNARHCATYPTTTPCKTGEGGGAGNAGVDRQTLVACDSMAGVSTTRWTSLKQGVRQCACSVTTKSLEKDERVGGFRVAPALAGKSSDATRRGTRQQSVRRVSTGVELRLWRVQCGSLAATKAATGKEQGWQPR